MAVRLATEPRPLIWRRYTYIVPGFLFLSLAELINHGLSTARLEESADLTSGPFAGYVRRNEVNAEEAGEGWPVSVNKCL